MANTLLVGSEITIIYVFQSVFKKNLTYGANISETEMDENSHIVP